MTRVVLIRIADGPGAIAVEERDVREPRIGEVLIRVHAAAVNPADVVMWRARRRFRAGIFHARAGRCPYQTMPLSFRFN